jgi:hypothetical protein
MTLDELVGGSPSAGEMQWTTQLMTELVRGTALANAIPSEGEHDYYRSLPGVNEVFEEITSRIMDIILRLIQHIQPGGPISLDELRAGASAMGFDSFMVCHWASQ